MVNARKGRPLCALSRLCPAGAALFLIIAPACGSSSGTTERQPVTLRIGFGLAAGTTPEIGIQQTARNIALDGLVRVGRDGRAIPVLAETWSVSDDGLVWNVRLRSSTFHSGKPADAESIRRILQAQLPAALGPAVVDIADIRATSDHELQFSLRRRSTFLLERLDVAIHELASDLSGTGPFLVGNSETNQVEMKANDGYYGGKPLIDRVTLMPYTSVRSAWADLLRGKVDMLYDVGVDALDSLQSSNDVKIFTFQRGYAYLLLLNVRRPYLADAGFRRELNAAIDRDALIADGLRGHGTPALGAVWPYHWAYSPDMPQFSYRPRRLTSELSGRRLKLLFGEKSLERLALVIQRQLQAISVETELELVPGEQVVARLQAGDFDAVLSDYIQGPNLVRPYLFWHSGAPYNFGHYSNSRADAALDAIRHAADDTAYKAGVTAFQRAIIDDPPAVFLAWRERARAVSNHFQVPAEPQDDVLASLHLWRPVAGERMGSRNEPSHGH
jgi:ABC-type transport system substrate-binding protein